MNELHESGIIKCRPTEHVYTAVLNSCAYCVNDSIEKREAMNIAVLTYKELLASDGAEPNQVTFSTFITALRNLMPRTEKRAAAAKTVFEKCTECGMVTDFVLRRLQQVLTPEEMAEIVGSAWVEGQVDLNFLPDEWTRNTVDQSKTKKRQRQEAAMA